MKRNVYVVRLIVATR